MEINFINLVYCFDIDRLLMFDYILLLNIENPMLFEQLSLEIKQLDLAMIGLEWNRILITVCFDKVEWNISNTEWTYSTRNS